MTEEIWQLQIDGVLCTGCGDCISVCPTNALALTDNTAVLANPDACTYCAKCEPICPTEAIALPYKIVLESVN